MSSNSIFNHVQSIPKLDAKNYRDWSFNIRMVLEQAEIWEIIIGAAKPIPISEEKATSDWLKSSAFGYRLIVMGLTEEVKRHVRHIVDNWDRGPWSILKDQFGKSTTISRVEIKRRMFNTRYDPEKGMSAYCGAIIECGNELVAMGESVGPNDIPDVILANLPSEFATYGASLMLHPTTLSTEQLSNFLMDYEKGLLEKSEEPPVMAAFVKRMRGKKSGDGGNGGELKLSRGRKCFRCKKPGHVAADCTAPKPVSSDDEGENEEGSSAAIQGPLALSASVAEWYDHMNDDGMVEARLL